MTSVTKKQEALLDELLKGCEKPEDILGEHGLMRALQKRLVERVLEGELTEELGYEAHAPSGHGSGNSRNGKTRKTIQTATDQFEIEVPRDRNKARDGDPEATKLYGYGEVSEAACQFCLP